MKLTPWFPGHIKPVRKGVYQQFCGDGKKIGYQYWNGKYWLSWFSSVEIAANAKTQHVVSQCFQNDKWRGILKEGQAMTECAKCQHRACAKAAKSLTVIWCSRFKEGKSHVK